MKLKLKLKLELGTPYDKLQPIKQSLPSQSFVIEHDFVWSVQHVRYTSTGCHEIIVPRLCGCCEGAVGSIISVFTQLHRPGFNLEVDTLFESI